MQKEKNINWLPLISKKAFPSLPFLSSSLNAEVLLPKDCVEDTVHSNHVYSYPSPFSITAHRAWKSQTHVSTFPYMKVAMLPNSDQ